MAVETLEPCANGTHTEFDFQACADWQGLQDNNDSTWIYTSVSGERHSVKTDAIIGPVATVNSVTHRWRARSNVGGGAVTGQPFFILSGSYTYGTGIDPGGAWVEKYEALNRPGGGNYVQGDFDGDFEWGLKCWSAGGQIQAAEADVIVDYNLPSGGFSLHLAMWLPPLIAVASHCLTKLDILTILSSLRTRPSNDEDFARIFEAFRRSPAYGYTR